MNIKGCREKKGISQVQLSEMLGVTAQTVWRWENSIRLPDLNTSVHIGRLLECSLDGLVEETPLNSPLPQTMKQRGAWVTVASAAI